VSSGAIIYYYYHQYRTPPRTTIIAAQHLRAFWYVRCEAGVSGAGSLCGRHPGSEGQPYILIDANANVNADARSDSKMPGKNRVIAVVDDEAKAFLVHYQEKNKFRSRDESVESILHEFPKLEVKIKEMEAKLANLSGNK